MRASPSSAAAAAAGAMATNDRHDPTEVGHNGGGAAKSRSPSKKGGARSPNGKAPVDPLSPNAKPGTPSPATQRRQADRKKARDMNKGRFDPQPGRSLGDDDDQVNPIMLKPSSGGGSSSLHSSPEGSDIEGAGKGVEDVDDTDSSSGEDSDADDKKKRAKGDKKKKKKPVGPSLRDSVSAKLIIGLIALFVAAYCLQFFPGFNKVESVVIRSRRGAGLVLEPDANDYVVLKQPRTTNRIQKWKLDSGTFVFCCRRVR